MLLRTASTKSRANSLSFRVGYRRTPGSFAILMRGINSLMNTFAEGIPKDFDGTT